MSDDVIVLENIVNPSDGMHVVRLMSNQELTAEALRRFGAGKGIMAHGNQEGGAWELIGSWPVRGSVDVKCEGWPIAKTFVMWRLSSGERMSEIIKKATLEYMRLFKDYPRYAFVSWLPSGIEDGTDVDGVLLFQAEWMPPRTVAVGWAPPPAPPQIERHDLERGA